MATPPLALSSTSLAVLQARSPALPAKDQAETGTPQRPAQVPAALVASGRGRLIDILV